MFFAPTLKQWAVKSYGNFRISAVTGLLTAAGGASDVVSFRWGSTTKDCIVWWIGWNFYVQTGYTAGQITDHALYFARSFTASPSGGTDLKPAVGTSKKKTSHADSALTAFQISTTGALTAGTRTLDGLAMARRSLWCPTTTAGVYLPDLGNMMDPDLGVMHLATNEGFVLQNVTAMGAAGVIVLTFSVAWSEIVPDSMFIPDNVATGNLDGGM